MPLYEYQCTKCKRRTEKIEKMDGPRLKKCPHCGGKVEQLLSAPAIQFKGSGWYVTDYAGKKGPGAEAAPAASGDGKAGESKAAEGKAGESKETPAKEAAPKEKKGGKKKE